MQALLLLSHTSIVAAFFFCSFFTDTIDQLCFQLVTSQALSSILSYFSSHPYSCTNAALCTCCSLKASWLVCFQFDILNLFFILHCTQCLEPSIICMLIRLEAVGVIGWLGPWVLLSKWVQWEALIQWIVCWSNSLRSLVPFVPLSQRCPGQPITFS